MSCPVMNGNQEPSKEKSCNLGSLFSAKIRSEIARSQKNISVRFLLRNLLWAAFLAITAVVLRLTLKKTCDTAYYTMGFPFILAIFSWLRFRKYTIEPIEALLSGEPIQGEKVGKYWLKIRDSIESLQKKDQIANVILNNSVDGLIAINPHGIIQYTSSAINKEFGYEEGELLGRNVKCLMPKEHSDHHDQYLSNYIATGIKNVIDTEREVLGLSKTGREFPIRLAIKEVWLGPQRFFTCSIRNMGEMQKKQEQSYKEQQQTLHSIQIEARKGSDIIKQGHEIVKKILDEHIKYKIEVKKGLQYLQETLTAIEEVKVSSGKTIDGLHTLENSISSTWQVLNIINSVADQTKIIAFNAELEASSAGEFGKNFQIVATEIRRLADHTNVSTNAVKNRIQQTQNSSGTLVSLIQEESEQIAKGSNIAHNLTTVFQTIESFDQSLDTMLQEVIKIQEEEKLIIDSLTQQTTGSKKE